LANGDARDSTRNQTTRRRRLQENLEVPNTIAVRWNLRGCIGRHQYKTSITQRARETRQYT
jgi:hypothetical protein